MPLQTNLTSLAQRVANEAKSLRTLINGNASDLTGLTTTAKTNLVVAINELQAAINSVQSGSIGINDSTTSSGATWSSQKITDMLDALKLEILGPDVSAALDTLKELGDALGNNEDAVTALTTSLSKRVAVDQAQSFTTAEQLQARQNIGAVAQADIGDTTTNFVTIFEAALV